MRLPLLLFSLVGFASAAIVAIDDRDAAWSFGAGWGEFSKDFPCPNCTSNPDASLAFQQTWRDTSSQATATLRFTGVGVTIYTICPGGNHYVGHFALFLDNQPQPDWKEQPSGCSEYQYNYQVYRISGLKNATHSITITNIYDPAATKQSNLLLDYAEIDDGKTTGTAPNDAAKTNMPVAAIVVPVLIIVSLSIFGMIYLVIRKKREQRSAAMRDETAPVPYKAPSLHDPESNIPMAVYLPGHRAPSNAAASVLARVQAAGNDPELEAALQIIASRTRLPAAQSQGPGSPPSPDRPTAATAAWVRDRKGGRSNPSSQNTTPQNSDLGANWSINAVPPSTVQRSSPEDAIPPAYTDTLTRR